MPDERDEYYFSAAGSAAVGLASHPGHLDGPVLAVIQSVIAPEMQGRVFTLINSAATAMAPLSLIIAGPLADRFGVQLWFVVSGIATAAMGISGYFIPAVMNLEQGRGQPDQIAGGQASMAASPVDGD
jgi:DHA3 family macrolide efflux protein-like MFS transporter